MKKHMLNLKAALECFFSVSCNIFPAKPQHPFPLSSVTSADLGCDDQL